MAYALHREEVVKKHWFNGRMVISDGATLQTLLAMLFFFKGMVPTMKKTRKNRSISLSWSKTKKK